MSFNTILLHLSLIDGIGPATIQTIIAYKPETVLWHELYDFSVSDWMQCGISERIACAVVSGLQDNTLLEHEMRLIEKHAIQVISIDDAAYPELLKHIHVPPAILYWQGAAITHNTKKIAIVGARKADQYAQQVIDRVVPELVSHGMTIVSGGARGADSMAHRAALDSGGVTVAVLGSGLLRPYPYENRSLFDRMIAHGGTLLSAFPLRTEPHPGHFPARNRIIAGLSDGVVVVQAARKSGARITAQFALEQGRDVFAVPGSLDNSLSDGCHALIQEGAKLITGADDILSEYGLVSVSDDAEKKNQVQKKQPVLALRNPLHEIIVTACSQPRSLEEVATETSLGLPQLQELLFDLQIAGLIEQDFSGLWKRV